MTGSRRPPWTAVPIAECGEPLVEVEGGDRIHVRPIYRALGHDHALGGVFLRAGVVDLLHQAAATLPEDLSLLLWDGWRPVELQRALYSIYRAELERSSGLGGSELETHLQEFVSIPSTDPRKPSPHLTGGAVDLTLADATGAAIDMGGRFDELTDRSRTEYYHDATSADGGRFHERRQLLLSVMTSAGFTNFPSEWWHFDYGNQFWAQHRGRPAFYGLSSLDAAVKAASTR